jgi:hypothetical protein
MLLLEVLKDNAMQLVPVLGDGLSHRRIAGKRIVILRYVRLRRNK